MMAAGIGGRLLPEIYEEPAAHGNAVQQEANRIAKVRQGAISHWATDKRVHCRDGCNTSSALQAHAHTPSYTQTMISSFVFFFVLFRKHMSL